jgi:uncharacterized protein (TIGR02246 family)
MTDATNSSRRALLLSAGALALPACTTTPARMSNAEAVAAITAAERAFAKTMADRDLEAFARLVAEDAVFTNGGQPLVGREAIKAAWAPLYAKPQAPFSWQPDLVVVAGSGDLGSSTGPVARPDGTVGRRFYSTWRLERDGRWRVVFDDGYLICAKPAG